MPKALSIVVGEIDVFSDSAAADDTNVREAIMVEVRESNPHGPGADPRSVNLAAPFDMGKLHLVPTATLPVAELEVDVGGVEAMPDASVSGEECQRYAPEIEA